MKLTGERLLNEGWEEEVSTDHFWYTKSFGKLSVSVKIFIKDDVLDYRGRINIEVRDFGNFMFLSGNPRFYSMYRGKIASMGEFNKLIKRLTT